MSESTHRIVIREIDKINRGIPFAVWEIVQRTACSRSSVIRTIRSLEMLSLIIHSRSGYGNRHYHMSITWSNANKVIDAFETAKALKLV